MYPYLETNTIYCNDVGLGEVGEHFPEVVNYNSCLRAGVWFLFKKLRLVNGHLYVLHLVAAFGTLTAPIRFLGTKMKNLKLRENTTAENKQNKPGMESSTFWRPQTFRA